MRSRFGQPRHHGTRHLVLNDGTDAAAVRDTMLDHGVIARPIGTNVIAFCPPLVITDDQIDETVAALLAAVS